MAGCWAVINAQSCLTLSNPMDYIAHQSPLSMGFPSQGYWSGLPFPTPGDPPDMETDPASSASFALAGGIFTIVPQFLLIVWGFLH